MNSILVENQWREQCFMLQKERLPIWEAFLFLLKISFCRICRTLVSVFLAAFGHSFDSLFCLGVR